ncbi:MAG TPA: hypothetical protein VIZ22_01585 [Candidatus Limnocylindrales bacterium]
MSRVAWLLAALNAAPLILGIVGTTVSGDDPLADRRFDGRRYDADRAASAFRERLSHEVGMATVADELLATIDASVRPASRGLWLREGGR